VARKRNPATLQEAAVDLDVTATVEEASTPSTAYVDVPKSVAELTPLDKLLFLNDVLQEPRKKLIAFCDPTADPLTTEQPKCDRKRHSVNDLRKILQVFMPKWDGRPATRKDIDLRAAWTKAEIGWRRQGGADDLLPLDELETQVKFLVNRFIPMKSHQGQWDERGAQLCEHVAKLIKDNEDDLTSVIRNGQRHPSILVTSELPNTFPLTPEAHGWGPGAPAWMSCIKADDLPEDHILRQKLRYDRLPQIGETGGAPYIVLGPSHANRYLGGMEGKGAIPAPRDYYHLATIEAFTNAGWVVWSQRYFNGLERNHDNPDQFAAYEKFKPIVKEVPQPVFTFPEMRPAPQVKGLDGVLLTLDITQHISTYLQTPFKLSDPSFQRAVAPNWNPFGQPKLDIANLVRGLLCPDADVPDLRYTILAVGEPARPFLEEGATKHPSEWIHLRHGLPPNYVLHAEADWTQSRQRCAHILKQMDDQPAPEPGAHIEDLLALRRIFVNEHSDKLLDLPFYSAKRWLSRVYNQHKAHEVPEAIWSIAESAYNEYEELRAEISFAQIEELQRQKYLGGGNGESH
jgi:hypothetical protein